MITGWMNHQSLCVGGSKNGETINRMELSDWHPEYACCQIMAVPVMIPETDIKEDSTIKCYAKAMRMLFAHFVKLLKEGNKVSFCPYGNSMKPKIKSGNCITVCPDLSTLEINDIVFCRVKKCYYIHLITDINNESFQPYQISNNQGHVNGWISKTQIYGKVVRVEDLNLQQ